MASAPTTTPPDPVAVGGGGAIVASVNDELDIVLAEAWERLRRSASERDEGFRMAQLATVGADGAPECRTVVLRAADRAARTVRFHTDARSTKVEEITARPDVLLIVYDKPGGRQIRLWGAARVHQGDDLARTAWDGARAQSRMCYRAQYPPGAAIAAPGDAAVTEAMRAPADPDDGFENFAPVVVTVSRLEWLDLAHGGHVRARFAWNGTAWEGGWIAP